MNRQQIIEKLTEIILSIIDLEEDDEIELGEEDILNSGEYGINSIQLIQIIVEVERVFNIEVEDEYLTMDFLSTIGSMADFIMEAIENA